MHNNFYLVQMAAVIFTLSIPIVAIIAWTVREIIKRKKETELKKSIVENHLDAETAQILVATPMTKEENNNKRYNTLTAGCMLLGLGLGYIMTPLFVTGRNPKGDLGFWIILAVGMGIGMFASFFIQRWLEAKDKDMRDAEDAE
ncbi:DUF6249 domain-containing protein [Prevotella dentasini]|uniref:DUF6249 domain-containing protein n=1 Tax=Prevotella dentasini TaxID=589537 RepID=UPI00046AD577|nr:DUF6249 domain-containing protein [Prevotella dentasini]